MTRTKTGSVIYDRGDVVVVPFPYTDMPIIRVRPALVLSRDPVFGSTGQPICAMITGAKKSSWPFDIELSDWRGIGLTIPSVVRFKLFTIDRNLVVRRTGRVGPAVLSAVDENIRHLFTETAAR